MPGSKRDYLDRCPGPLQRAAPARPRRFPIAKFDRHPARLAAIAAGEKKWYGPACPEHGDTPRHSSSGHCVICNRQRSAIQAMLKSQGRKRYVKLADRPERLAAMKRGAPIYWGPLCAKGHAGSRKNRSPRYTRTARCVACSRDHYHARADMAAFACDKPDAAHDIALAQGRMTRELSAVGPAGSALGALRQIARRLRAMITSGR